MTLSIGHGAMHIQYSYKPVLQQLDARSSIDALQTREVTT